jgi:hypothetical protein
VSTTYATAIKPAADRADFRLPAKRIQLKSIVWSSPVEELDATSLDFAEDLTCHPMQLFPTALEMAKLASMIHVIGHTVGRDDQLIHRNSPSRTTAHGRR